MIVIVPYKHPKAKKKKIIIIIIRFKPLVLSRR